MLQNLDYMILLDADISFCMVCKLWYISIRCIFKNLALKLRIYNFRDVCVCNCPPHLPSPSPNPFLLSFYYPTSSTIQAVFGVFAILFAVYFSLLFLQLLITFYIYFYTLYIAFLFYGSYISIVFKNGSMVLQRTMYDPFLRAILIPNYTYFQPIKLQYF